MFVYHMIGNSKQYSKSCINFCISFPYQVSWVKDKSEDSDILTVGQYTFVNDERFSVFLSTNTWTLVIKFVQARDAGLYECQISTEPKMALKFRLNVIGKRSSKI